MNYFSFFPFLFNANLQMAPTTSFTFGEATLTFMIHKSGVREGLWGVLQVQLQTHILNDHTLQCVGITRSLNCDAKWNVKWKAVLKYLHFLPCYLYIHIAYYVLLWEWLVSQITYIFMLAITVCSGGTFMAVSILASRGFINMQTVNNLCL